MTETIEESLSFTPRFDDFGLIGCITICARTKNVLMFAFMNQEALEKTMATRQAHYWSRSRKSLWHKGESSGAVQEVVSISIDCDQDCLLMEVHVAGDGNDTCHTGRKTCFYRHVDLEKKILIKN